MSDQPQTATDSASPERAARGIRERAAERERGPDIVSEYVEPEEESASLADMRVTRSFEDGRIEPIKVTSVFEGHVIRFRPTTYRDRNYYRLDERGLIQLPDPERLQFLREHMVEPGFEDVILWETFAERRGLDFDYEEIGDRWEEIPAKDRSRIRETTFLEDLGYSTVDDLLTTIQRYSRDLRRNQLPRPVGEDEEGKAAAEE